MRLTKSFAGGWGGEAEDGARGERRGSLADPCPIKMVASVPLSHGAQNEGATDVGIPALVKGTPGSGVICYHGVPLLQQMEPASFENWTSLLPSETWASLFSPLSLLAFSS